MGCKFCSLFLGSANELVYNVRWAHCRELLDTSKVDGMRE